VAVPWPYTTSSPLIESESATGCRRIRQVLLYRGSLSGIRSDEHHRICRVLHLPGSALPGFTLRDPLHRASLSSSGSSPLGPSSSRDPASVGHRCQVLFAGSSSWWPPSNPLHWSITSMASPTPPNGTPRYDQPSLHPPLLSSSSSHSIKMFFCFL
jgi:hypothetical protein